MFGDIEIETEATADPAVLVFNTNLILAEQAIETCNSPQGVLPLDPRI